MGSVDGATGAHPIPKRTSQFENQQFWWSMIDLRTFIYIHFTFILLTRRVTKLVSQLLISVHCLTGKGSIPSCDHWIMAPPGPRYPWPQKLHGASTAGGSEDSSWHRAKPTENILQRTVTITKYLRAHACFVHRGVFGICLYEQSCRPAYAYKHVHSSLHTKNQNNLYI